MNIPTLIALNTGMQTDNELKLSGVRAISELLRREAAARSNTPAILGLGSLPLTYGQLWSQIGRFAGQLRLLAVSNDTRVAVVLQNGPLFASSLLGVMCCATCVPLSADLQHLEMRGYLQRTRARILVTQKGMPSAARDIAIELGLQILELETEGLTYAGELRTATNRVAASITDGWSKAKDIALILHTSGTTGAPKKVPISHEHLLASANNISNHLRLTRDDRCLNVMPLFHSHGIVGALLASLVGGGSLVCAPGYTDGSFCDCVAEFQPTWYTAAPTIHQFVIDNVAAYRQVAPQHRFRFIRSSSAPLSGALLMRLQETMGAPVIESFGMTEWSQMASTPLDGGKVGSVGVATSVQVAIVDSAGQFVNPGVIGEVVVKGPVLGNGYEDDEAATTSAFYNGWFRTGDQGKLDSDGFLFITGRLKEIINRGGEKVAPFEIEAMLQEHPAVKVAVAFAIPHQTLGEDIGVAIVLCPGCAADEEEMRGFLMDRMATYKVPSNYFFVDDIPRSATGKIQRIDMHRRLAGSLHKPYVPPRNEVERVLETLFRAVLCCGAIGIDDNFFNLGGDSLLAMALFLRLDEVFARKMPMATIFRAATIRQLARIYGEPTAPARSTGGALVPIVAKGSMPPIFAMPGIYGNVVCFADLARELGDDQPFYGLQSIGLDGVEAPLETIADIASRNIEELRVVQPHGPYYLLGACFGATVAFEMARQLIDAGEQVAFCGLLDPSLRGGTLVKESIRLPRFMRRFVDFSRFLLARIRLYRSELRGLSFRERAKYIRSKLRVATEVVHTGDMLHGNAREFNQTRVYQANLNALLRHQPVRIPTGIGAYEIFQTKRRIEQAMAGASVNWESLAAKAVYHTMPGKDSGDMLQRDNARNLARTLADRLRNSRAL